MELIDTHCHLTFDPLFADISAVIEHSVASGVASWITVGTDPDHNKKAVELADRFDNLYAAVGIHPHYAKSVTAQSIAALKQIAQHQKVVAVGETGLDFHYNFSAHTDQQRLFVEHLNLARELNLPVIIHSRNAFDETIDILDQYGSDLRKIVFHCFSGTAEQAQTILDKGFYISFTGVVTFKNATVAKDAAKLVPLDRLMIETDCPYMSPEPMRKQKINEPALLIYTAKFIADLKKMDCDSFASAITAATKSFFNLPTTNI